MMTKGSRILVLVASLALGLAYVLPVWTIQLEAPQYPEGLGMVIHLNTITGQKPHDLGNINNLNHYIGMKRIEPESIPELVVMPVIVGVLLLLGVAVAALGRRGFLYGWIGLFLTVSVVGLADFWKWEYDYGHDLDEENAIIKIPGMSYQPPLIGSKQILNFTAHSWPGAGGLVLMGSALVGVLVAGAEWRRSRREGGAGDGGGATPERAPLEPGRRPAGSTGAGDAADAVADAADGPTRGRGSVAVLAAAVAACGLAAQGCGPPEPRPLQPGVDACATCLMGVEDEGHGAEVVSTTGRIHTFDSVECMVAFLQHDPEADDAHSAWVTDFAGDRALIPAAGAHFLISETLTSPMGLGITAFHRTEDREGALHAFGGRAAEWADVQALVAARWPEGSPARGHGGHASMATGG